MYGTAGHGRVDPFARHANGGARIRLKNGRGIQYYAVTVMVITMLEATKSNLGM